MEKIKNKKILKLISIVVIIATLIIIIAIGALISYKKKFISELPQQEEGEITIIDSLEKVNIRNNYYTAKNIVEKYFLTLCNINKQKEDVLILEYDEEVKHLEAEQEKERDISKQKIYSFFDKTFIDEKQLSVDNIQEKLGNYKDLYVSIEDMYVRDITEFLRIYFVNGTITEKQTMQAEKFELMIATDTNHGTFNIYTSDYIEKNNLYELSKKEDFNENIFNITEIEDRKYNKYEYQLVDDETYVKDLFKTYTQNIKYGNTNFAYERLDEEYKQKRFGEKIDFEKYIEENKKRIVSANIKEYKINKLDSFKQYICIDQQGKYYIFNESSIMDYDLMLDVYTVDLPEFIERYNVSKDEKKVKLNIQKILEALKENDYRYLYSKLDETFKRNNFKTEKDLETFMKNNFINENNIEHVDIIQEGTTFIYRMKIKDEINSTQEKEFNIIMKLKEDTNFVFSFNIK